MALFGSQPPLAARQLEGWRDGTRTWVTLESVEARLAEQPKPGRPRKDTAAAEATVGEDAA